MPDDDSPSSVTALILAKMKVKVTKKVKDDRKSLCGEPLIQKDDDDPGYFLIPAHQGDYIKDLFGHVYDVSPAMPAEDPKPAAKVVKKNAVQEKEGEEG